MKKISIELYGETYDAVVSDTAAQAFLALLLPDYHQIVSDEKGLQASLERFQIANRKILDDAGDDNQKAAEALFDLWGERLYSRMIFDNTIRKRMAQRIKEICPGLPKYLVDYDDPNFTLNLDSEEAMKLAVAIISTLPDGKKPVPKPKEETPKVEEEDLPLEPAKAIAQVQPARPEAKGFGKAPEEEAVVIEEAPAPDPALLEQFMALPEEKRKALLGVV